MLNIKEILEEIKKRRGHEKKPLTDFEVRCMSIKLLYGELKKTGNLKNMRRLRFLIYYYPTLLEKNRFYQIERCIKIPSNTILTITRERPWLYEHEKYAIEKCDCNYRGSKNFYVEDFFKFYGI